MISLKGELFLMFDSGIGDSNRMLTFSTMKMLSILQEAIGLLMGEVVPKRMDAGQSQAITG